MTTSREVPISLKIPLNNMENIIEVRNLKYKYDSESENYTLNDVSFQVKKGEWLSIVGHNGSGKSTTVRLIDGLLEAESGDIIISGDKLTAENVWEKRRQIGMVFQNPDNQFVGATVEDDVAFGLENQGLAYCSVCCAPGKRAPKATQFGMVRAKVAPPDERGEVLSPVFSW